MATNPDAFMAFSYPPDTFMLTEQAQIVGFNPQFMYVAIGGVFPTYKAKFGNKVNGILVYGGIDPGAPGMADYDKAHQAMFNRAVRGRRRERLCRPRRSCSRRSRQVGEIDRKKIRDAIASGTFKTYGASSGTSNQLNANPWAVGQWQNGEIVGLYPGQQGRRQAAAVPEAGMVVTYQVTVA